MHELVSNCFLASSHTDPDFYFKKINKFFYEIQKHPDVAQLLQIVKLCKGLKFIFDFRNETVAFIGHRSFSAVKGACLDNGTILIAGGNLRDANIIGTLAHELTHLAMRVIYKNNSRPFYSGDWYRKNEFNKIIEECHEEYMFGGIHAVDTVFQIYRDEQFATELIARVPQILVGCSESVIETAKVKYQKLFEYYSRYICYDINYYLKFRIKK